MAGENAEAPGSGDSLSAEPELSVELSKSILDFFSQNTDFVGDLLGKLESMLRQVGNPEGIQLANEAAARLTVWPQISEAFKSRGAIRELSDVSDGGICAGTVVPGVRDTHTVVKSGGNIGDSLN